MKTKNLILVSLFAALAVVGAKISIPIPPVPITLQLFISCFAGIILGGKLGLLSQIVYLLIGLAGVPVFATASAGPTYVLSPTFGYLIGFALSAYVVGKISEKFENLTFPKAILAVYSGIGVIYIIGVSYLFLIFNLYLGKSMSYLGAIKIAFLPFILKDLVLGLLVAIIAVKLIPALKKSGVYN